MTCTFFGSREIHNREEVKEKLYETLSEVQRILQKYAKKGKWKSFLSGNKKG